MFGLLRESGSRKRLANRLYAAIVQRARAPVFFTVFKVPDTIDGRFDLLALHAWMVLDRLRDGKSAALSQDLVDAIFAGFDSALRDLGAGDMTIGRRIKALADAFYGRLEAYEACAEETDLSGAILRNLYRGDAARADCAAALARHVREARAQLDRADAEGGVLDFGPLPQMEVTA
jgi:cytochrome b pre-mRNA-processing protein 3